MKLPDKVRRPPSAVEQMVVTLGSLLALWFPFLPFFLSAPVQQVSYPNFCRQSRVVACRLYKSAPGRFADIAVLNIAREIVVITRDQVEHAKPQVEHAKPDPALFVAAAERLQIDIEVALEAGWRFTFIAPRLQVTAFGLTRPAATYRAAVKATHEVTSWGFAAFEVGNVDLQDLVGIYRANLLVHVRQPRPSPYLPELKTYYHLHQFQHFDEIFWRASNVQRQLKGF